MYSYSFSHFFQDPCGITCAVFTYLLIMYGEFAVMMVILFPYGLDFYTLVHGVLFNAFAISATIAHVRTMMTDPVGSPLFSLYVFVMFVK